MRKHKTKVSGLGSPNATLKITHGPSRRQIGKALFGQALGFIIVNTYRDSVIDTFFARIGTITVSGNSDEVTISGPVASPHLIKKWGSRVKIRYSLHTRRGTARFYKH